MPPVSLTFLGTGTSAGVPMIGCECETCTSPDPRDKRMRCSVTIGYGDTQVLIDTTPELRLQALANDVKHIDAVVYTHAHADHIMGLDDLRRFNALRGEPLDVFVDPTHYRTIHECFGYAFRKPTPNAGVFRPYLIPHMIDGPFEIAGVSWTPIPLLHGAMPIHGFRVGNLAYCTDVSEIPPASWDLLAELDVLVLDALQWAKHPTHFNIAEALAVVERLKPKRTLFTHLAHGVLHARDQPKLPPGVAFAVDGQKVIST